LLNRLFDQELAPDEYAWIDKHLKDCLSCQEALRDTQSISTLFKSNLVQELSRAKLEQVEDNVLGLIQRKEAPWWMKLRGLIVSKKFYVPITATVAVLVLLFSLARPPSSVSGPSAIINSFEGDVGSVMILETQKSRQTILWFNEASVSSGENGKTKTDQSAL
jgi:hypothetical protein